MTHAEDGAGRCTQAVLAGLIAALALAGMLHAHEASAAEDDMELAKKTQNPLGDLISVPFQNNFNFMVETLTFAIAGGAAAGIPDTEPPSPRS